jgi:hypothetical protein
MLVAGLQVRTRVSTRRRTEPPQTVALRPIELNALLQMVAGGDEPLDPAGSTVEMIPLEAEPDPEAEAEAEAEAATTRMVRLDHEAARIRPTVAMRPLTASPAPKPVLARGSEPVPRARRVTRRGPPGSRG